jgi:hypothetical protein
MRSLITLLLAVFAGLALFAAATTFVTGPAIPRRVEAVELVRDPASPPRDLAIAGVVVRNGSLADHRIDGVYYLPLLDAETAARIDELGHWTMPKRSPGARIAVVRLELDQVPGSGLRWDETISRPGGVGTFVASGAVSTRVANGPIADLLWERCGLRADDVLLVDHGNPSFGYRNAAVVGAMGLLAGWLFVRRWRRPGNVSAAAPAGEAPAPASGRVGSLLGAIGAALLAALVFGRRFVDDVVRTAGDSAAASARQVELDPAQRAALEAIDRAKDAADLVQAVEVLAPVRDGGRLVIRRGTEVFGRETDGAWHLAEGTWMFAGPTRDGRESERAVVARPERAAGEDTSVRFLPHGEHGCLARIEHLEAGRSERIDVALRFTIGDFAALERGDNAELVCTAEGLAVLAADQARQLRELVAKATRSDAARCQVTVAGMRTPRFLIRGPLLLVDVGEQQFDIATRSR